MKITKEIQKAINIYLDANGKTAKQLAIMLHVSNSTVSCWINGKSETMRPSKWIILKPLIEPYMTSSIKKKLIDDLDYYDDNALWDIANMIAREFKDRKKEGK